MNQTNALGDHYEEEDGVQRTMQREIESEEKIIGGQLVMKKIMLLISFILLLSGCTQPTVETKQAVATNCEKGEIILDNDEDPDWEIDLDGDCEGDIEFEGNESKTKKTYRSRSFKQSKTIS